MSQEFTIGRDDSKEQADIQLSGAHISGMHAMMRIDDNGHLWIKDINSLNGTWVTNRGAKRKIDTSYAQVRSGETLSLGGEEYAVDYLFSLLPSRPAPILEKKIEGTQGMMRCKHCGTPTPIGKPCTKCKR